MVKVGWPKSVIWDFGLPEDRRLLSGRPEPVRKRKKNRAVRVSRWRFLVTSWPWTAPNPLGNVPDPSKVIPSSFQAISSERKWREKVDQVIASWKNWCCPKELQFWTPLLSDFKGRFWEVLRYSPIFMCGETEYGKEIFYFTRKITFFEVTK